MKAEQLRKAILQMAIQGKLVPQDPNDEPASVLLERIRAEKQKLIKEGKIKKDKTDSIIFKGDDNCHYEKIGNEIRNIEDEIPFEIPDSWAWVRLGNCTSYSQSKEKISANSIMGDMWSLDLEDIEKETGRIIAFHKVADRKIRGDKIIFYKKQILYSKLRPYLKKVLIAPMDGICSPELVPFDVYGNLNSKFILSFLKSPYVDNEINSVTYGVKMPRVGTETMINLLLPVPPITEQSRIVAEIERFEPLIAEYDRLEQQKSKIDGEIYDKLKKSILQYAIQGRLVPQDPRDEPASVLLERIRTEKKAKLGKKYVESYIYKGDDNCYYEKVGKNEPVKLEDLPFDIPDSWSWARLKDIVYNNGQKTPTSDFSYIDIGSIDNIHQKLSSVENIVSADKAPSRARKIIKYGDILYSTVRPYLHNMCIIDKRFSKEAIASTGFAVLSCEEGMVNKYLFYYMLSPIFDQYANSTENSKGVAYPAINDDRLYKALVPIPPQSEQKRIWKNIEVIFQSIE